MGEGLDVFLQAQTESLSRVDGLKAMRSWQLNFAAAWTKSADRLADEVNQAWNLKADYAISPDLGWLCAESGRNPAPETWLLLSVNPGISDVLRESEARKYGLEYSGDTRAELDSDRYQDYFSNYLPQLRSVLAIHGRQHGAWWNNALVFLHGCAGLKKPPHTCHFHDELRVLGWELWPFRSRKDGLTSARTNHKALHAFARASLAAALRQDVNAVVVASSAGYDLLEALQHDLDLEQCAKTTIAGVNVALYRSKETSRPIFALRRQLFSGFGVVSRERRAALVGWVRDHLASSDLNQAPCKSSLAVNARPMSTVAPRPIRLQRAQGTTAPLFFTVAVIGNDDLNAFSNEDDPHQRIAGYWKLGSGKMAEAIKAALAASRRVFLIGRVGREVARVIEVSTTPHLPPKSKESLGDLTFCQITTAGARSDSLYFVDGRPWAVAYTPKTADRTAIRYRIMTAEVMDAEWIGCKLVGDLRGSPFLGPFCVGGPAPPARYDDDATSRDAEADAPCP